MVGAVLSCGGQIEAISVAGDPQPDGSASSSGGDPFADASAPMKADASVDAAMADAAPPPQADGICSQTSVSAGVFDADCVYLLGTLSQNADAWMDALIHMDRPNDYATGFGYERFAPIIRPSDGRALFEASGDRTAIGLYRYTAPSLGFPDPSLAGQALEPSVTCTGPMLDRFYVFPDDGAILYGCGNQQFVTGSTQPVAMAGYLPIATGRNRLIVASQTLPEIVLVQSGVVTPVIGLTGRPYAFRSLPSGAMWMATSSMGILGELREIALDGSTQVVGTYDFGTTPPYGPGPNCALEPSGALVCITRLTISPPSEGVVRFTFTNPPEVLYDERKNPVKIHISELATGP